MPPKRAHDGAAQHADAARARKKQKTAAARTIAVQAGPSAAGAGVAAPHGVPGAIDVERFAEARAFEIGAMQAAMRAARGGAAQRAFQALPRALRRRAAAHDVRRVPVRLREKARAEMDPARRKALGRPKRGAATLAARTQSFLKRQRDKTWLETHLWHAKRMHMANLWGFRLAETPTEKAFRPSHRAAVHGAIVHDASYVATIAAAGPQARLERMLARCCDCQGAGPGAVRYTLGSRVHETHLYEPDAYPFGLIAPVTILWQPRAPAEAAGPAPKTRRGAAREPAPDANAQRTLWIRVHPAAWDDAWAAVQRAASATLADARAAGEGADDAIELADLRAQVNCFEVTGPRATQVLRGALAPAGGDARAIFAEFWRQAQDLQTPASVPRGMVVGLTVHDPRLSFPPKAAAPRAGRDGGRPGTSHGAAFTVYPSAELARSGLWDCVAGAAAPPRYTKQALDERRSKHLIPGTALAPQRDDDRVPVLLVQHTLGGGMHGWTLLLPRHWGTPFFLALAHTGATRVAGQRERRAQAFEAGALAFPGDYPGTGAYARAAAAAGGAARARWERRPRAKRVQWAAVGTASPWAADWGAVLGGAGAGLLAAQRGAAAEAGAPRVWLLHGAEAARVAGDVRAGVAALRARRGLAGLGAAAEAELLGGALVAVRVAMCGRGAPGELAEIYAGDAGDGAAAIGYVTTGSYALAQGRGAAVGAVALGALAGLGAGGAVRVKDRASAVCRAARLSVLGRAGETPVLLM